MVLQDFTKWKNYSKVQKARNQNDDRRIVGYQTITDHPVVETATRLKPITDAEGLKQASLTGKPYIHGGTLYIQGSQTAQDWMDNIKNIPDWGTINNIKNVGSTLLKAAGYDVPAIPDAPADWGNLKSSDKYINASKVLKEHPEIKRVVGHSQGGSIALELQKEDPKLKTTVYGTPVFDPLGLDAYRHGYGNIDRYANAGDPVSMFDASAHVTQQASSDNKGVSGFFNHNYNSTASKRGASDFIRFDGGATDPNYSGIDPGVKWGSASYNANSSTIKPAVKTTTINDRPSGMNADLNYSGRESGFAWANSTFKPASKINDQPGMTYDKSYSGINPGVQWSSKFNQYSNPDGMTYNLTQ